MINWAQQSPYHSPWETAASFCSWTSSNDEQTSTSCTGQATETHNHTHYINFIQQTRSIWSSEHGLRTANTTVLDAVTANSPVCCLLGLEGQCWLHQRNCSHPSPQVLLQPSPPPAPQNPWHQIRSESRPKARQLTESQICRLNYLNHANTFARPRIWHKNNWASNGNQTTIRRQCAGSWSWRGRYRSWPSRWGMAAAAGSRTSRGRARAWTVGAPDPEGEPGQ